MFGGLLVDLVVDWFDDFFIVYCLDWVQDVCVYCGVWYGLVYLLIDGKILFLVEMFVVCLQDNGIVCVVGICSGGYGCGFMSVELFVELFNSYLCVCIFNCVWLCVDGSDEVVGIVLDFVVGVCVGELVCVCV